jgi:DNA replication protein DnaC
MTLDLKNAYAKLHARMVVLPDEDTCKVCGYWELTPEVIRRMEAGGRNPLEARCKCKEWAARQMEKDVIRRSEANMPRELDTSRRSFGNFDCNIKGTEQAFNAALAFARDSKPDILVICGTTGSGKSHLLEAVGRYLLDHKERVRYEQAGMLIDRLRASFADQTEPELTDWYNRFPVLLLDEFHGGGRHTEYSEDKLTRVVEQRIMWGGRLVIATNQTYEDVLEVNPRIASRLWDVSEGSKSQVVALTCGDHRIGGG